MTNAEPIEALQTDIREVEDDPVNTLRLMWRAADALEAADKRIKELESQEERAFAARNIAAESEADADNQLSVLMQEYFERYEPTYNSEDGSM